MATTSDDCSRFCTATHPEECVDRRPGRYFVAIYWLQNGSGHRVQTSELGEYLGVQPASVTGMLGRLDDTSLVEYERYRGVKLANRGDTVAQELAWRQCTVRVFFAVHLDLELNAHTAYRIGYTLPTHGIERLTDLVDCHQKTPCCRPTSAESACLFSIQTC
ncbi:metal-dependent transcriptional regulator [Halobium palmae]|uniref:Metal-dependent transcriptional regulator n=1 Tax=Halobium palmae TaxID=1776492 RepID=A0ABD5RVS5_9EURY